MSCQTISHDTTRTNSGTDGGVVMATPVEECAASMPLHTLPRNGYNGNLAMI